MIDGAPDRRPQCAAKANQDSKIADEYRALMFRNCTVSARRSVAARHATIRPEQSAPAPITGENDR